MSMRMSMRRMCLTTTAALVLAGACPALGRSADRLPSSSESSSFSRKSCQKVMNAARRELGKASSRMCQELRDAAHDAEDAIDALAEGEPSEEDIEAMEQGVDEMMADALDDALAKIEARGMKCMMRLSELGASEQMMSKCQDLIDRMAERVQERSESLSVELDEHMAEAFAAPDSADDDADCDETESGDDGEASPESEQG